MMLCCRFHPAVLLDRRKHLGCSLVFRCQVERCQLIRQCVFRTQINIASMLNVSSDSTFRGITLNTPKNGEEGAVTG